MKINIAEPVLGEEEFKLIKEVIDSGILSQGQKQKIFEEEFARKCGCRFSVGTCNGTCALHAALSAHNIGKGDEVITTPFTFIAAANSILYTGAKPVFVDIVEDTYNIDPEKINEAVSPKTKAILPVHLYGHPADMLAINEIAKDNSLTVIEDCCQAHFAKVGNKFVGSENNGCFSFYPSKNMTTGEGGMITTNDENIYKKLRMIVNQGCEVKYQHDILGYNFRMNEFEAAIGISQLKKIDEFTKKRVQNAALLSEKICTDWLDLPITKKGYTHVFHQYTVGVNRNAKKTREEIINSLNKKGIATSIHYPIPVHHQKIFKELGYTSDLPVSEGASRGVFSLPVHPNLKKEETEYIAKAVNEACS